MVGAAVPLEWRGGRPHAHTGGAATTTPVVSVPTGLHRSVVTDCRKWQCWGWPRGTPERALSPQPVGEGEGGGRCSDSAVRT
ncbi:hypothetical protein E2C01_013276 [Portunus trituberculatus]|uniref:Uncharacterized protein n=1 Tax=Portunus trituberculatus TaxID=210409 RepID=A0A5B7DGU6_PORTR|nr:hypothetical protein [Portunus trituberculatus]